MSNKNSDKLTYDKLIELVDKVKACSGCNEVKLVGNDKTFKELTIMGFPLTEFKCEEALEIDESQLYIIPIDD